MKIKLAFLVILLFVGGCKKAPTSSLNIQLENSVESTINAVKALGADEISEYELNGIKHINGYGSIHAYGIVWDEIQCRFNDRGELWEFHLRAERELSPSEIQKVSRLVADDYGGAYHKEVKNDRVVAMYGEKYINELSVSLVAANPSAVIIRKKPYLE